MLWKNVFVDEENIDSFSDETLHEPHFYWYNNKFPSSIFLINGNNKTGLPSKSVACIFFLALSFVVYWNHCLFVDCICCIFLTCLKSDESGKKVLAFVYEEY